MVGGEIVEQWTRRQNTVALLVTKAEYIANCKGAKDPACQCQLFVEMNIPHFETSILYTDSEKPIKLLKVFKFQ